MPTAHLTDVVVQRLKTVGTYFDKTTSAQPPVQSPQSRLSRLSREWLSAQPVDATLYLKRKRWSVW